MTLKVFGHTPPDTDTVCAPIAYAWYLSNKKGKDATAFVGGALNKETAFVLQHFNIETPAVIDKLTADDHVVVMDTNNPDELLEGINDAVIEEIIDHHKLVGSLTTEKPIPVTIVPIACTATIVWEKMKSDGNTDIPKEIAGIMLGAIISDTLKLTSPTTTDRDKAAVDELATIADENVDELAKGMFAAKSDLTGMSAQDILIVDSKIFTFGNKKVRISVLETTNPGNALAMKEELLANMDSLKKREKLDYAFFFAVDILKSEATLLTTTDEEKRIAEKAFQTTFDGDFMNAPGVVSRKKQIVPALEPVIAG